jgi:hypothetical protein
MTRITVSVLALAAVAAGFVTWASPPSGVTPFLLARGTYQPFKVETDEDSSTLDFEGKARAPLDIVVRRHDYAPDSTTGWHTHPGPVFITVTKGTLAFYEYDDPTCTPTFVSEGQGYVDTGRGHVGRNLMSEPAQDVTVIIAPVGLPFRGELPAPNPNCGF